MKTAELHFYETAAQEIAERRPVPGLMAKAFSDADGDERKAVARYLKLRAGQLLADHQAAQIRRNDETNAQRASELKAKQNEQNPPRMCCWNCASYESTGWFDKTSGVCRAQKKKTTADAVCENHEWKTA